VVTGPKHEGTGVTRDDPGLALLYARVSTSMQATDGISLGVQERELRRAAELHGFSRVELVSEIARSGKSISGRPALKSSLRRLENKEADALFVTRIDRLARSTQDFLFIIDHSEKYNWRLVLLDLNLDTSSYSSRFVVTIMSALAEMERAIIAERQKEVHRDRRESGKVWGVTLGPKTKISQETRDLIDEYREKGLSYREIAEKLDAAGVPPTRGEKWQPSSIHRLVNNLKERSEKKGGPEE
jgi:DNA invertase Pin-like site-specific DNA recombinase